MPKRHSVWSAMEHNVSVHTRTLSNSSRKNALRAVRNFRAWAQDKGITSAEIRADQRGAVSRWLEDIGGNYAKSTLHTMAAGVCMGLRIPMDGLVSHGTASQQRKSRGHCTRSKKALERDANKDIVAFQMAVGGRRSALQRLRGCDIVPDPATGQMAVRFLRDKGGKNQLQVIAPDDVPLVRSYFGRVAPNELLWPEKIDKNLDLHGLRAAHARSEYQRYAQIASTPEGRAQLREALILRYQSPDYGNKAYLHAVKNRRWRDAQKLMRRFLCSEASDRPYNLRGACRQTAIDNDLPTSYDRLALCCVSVFCLSHWRNEVTVKHYML